jgi:hypothetical protein
MSRSIIAAAVASPVRADARLTPLCRLNMHPLRAMAGASGVAVSLARLLSTETGRRVVLDVERWAELRREHFVRGVSIKELQRRTGSARNTIRSALRSEVTSAFQVPERDSKLDPFKEEIHDLFVGAGAKLTPLRSCRARVAGSPVDVGLWLFVCAGDDP